MLATIKRRKKFLDVVPSADDGVVEETNGEDTTGENDGGNTSGGGTNTGGDNTDDDADDGPINGGDDIKGIALSNSKRTGSNELSALLL